MSSPGTPLPVATFPVPPPVARTAIGVVRDGHVFLNNVGLEFFTKMWASIQGAGGVKDDTTVLFDMSGDATITNDGVLTISQGAVDEGKLADDAVATAKIQDAAVTFAKIQNETDGTLLGRSSGADGAPQEISVAVGLLLAAGVLNAYEYIGVVGSVPAGSAMGARAFFTDANSTTFLAAAAGGGVNKSPGFWDGTIWRLG